MIILARSAWKIVGAVLVIGLAGSCAAVLALAGPAGPATRRSGHAQRALRQAPAVNAVSSRLGLQLMSQAAVACQSDSYSGVQIVAWWGKNRTTASVLQVWHQPGSDTLTMASGTEAEPLGAGQQASLAGATGQDGILWVSSRLLALMRAHYLVGYAGQGWAEGRPSRLVEVRRPDRSLAARFWLDAATGLPLRREIFSARSRMISEDAFISLELGSGGVGTMPDADARAWTDQLDGGGLAELRARGWRLPPRLSGLALMAASKTAARSGEIVHLSYSDGLWVVSLFVQRGQLPRALPGWRRVTAAGQSVFAADPDQRNLSWSAHGFVYTVIADAPPATVSEVVAALPHEHHQGFWQRIGRGFARLASWANPFR